MLIVSLIAYFLANLLFVECQDGAIHVHLNKSTNNSECILDRHTETFCEFSIVEIDVSSQSFMNYIWIELPMNMTFHFPPNTEYKANTFMVAHNKFEGKWTFVILHLNMENSSTSQYLYNGQHYAKATCTLNFTIYNDEDSSESLANSTCFNTTESGKCNTTEAFDMCQPNLPKWAPIAAVSAIITGVVIILIEMVLIFYYKRKARDALPYNSLEKKSEEDFEASVRYSTNPVQKKNVAVAMNDRNSGLYEDPNISFPGGRPPPAGMPPNIPNTPRPTHLEVTKKLPDSPRKVPISKLEVQKNSNHASHKFNHNVPTKTTPKDIESSIANRPPLPLPHEETYEEMESDLPEDYDDPQVLELPPKPKFTQNHVAVPPNPTPPPPVKKPPVLPPPVDKVMKIPKGGPVTIPVSELNEAFKQRSTVSTTAAQSPVVSKKKKNMLTNSPKPILSPPSARHKPKVPNAVPTRQNHGHPFINEEHSQLRMRPKPKAQLPQQNQIPMIRQPPIKVPVMEAIYNEGEGNSSEDEWNYEPLKPDRYYRH